VRTALDTNVISSIWSGESSATAVRVALIEALSLGGLVISPMVYGELRAYPGATKDFVDGFLDATKIAVDWELNEAVWQLTAERFALYAERRRVSKMGNPKRLMADFLVGAHAVQHADRLMTLDRRRYEREFGELVLV